MYERATLAQSATAYLVLSTRYVWHGPYDNALRASDMLVSACTVMRGYIAPRSNPHERITTHAEDAETLRW
jgi:hypothetical protein